MFTANNLSAQDCYKGRKWLNLSRQKICLDTMMGKTEYNKLKKQINTLKLDLKTERENSKIYKFLIINDTTIFEDNFQKLDVEQIHPMFREYYLLIENIRELRELLPPDIKVEQLETLKRNNKLEKAQQKIRQVNSFDSFDYLSEPQKQYWRKLVNRYNTYNKYANQ